MSRDLPPPLRLWLAEQARGLRHSGLRSGHADLSGHYRAGASSQAAIRSDQSVLAYALARMPATYAAVAEALARLAAARPGFAPESAQDLGCGPGTAMVAACDTFAGLQALEGIDHHPLFLAFAGRLVAENGYGSARRMTFRQRDLTAAADDGPADLVLCSYALVELDEERALAAVRRAWSATAGALVLVEPGSRAGFARLRAARCALIAAGAHILAPCTHHAGCPIVDPDWCHFSVRLQRSRDHRLIKGADVPYEDEKFSYLIAARADAGVQPAARIVAPARHAKAGSRFTLCRREGIAEVTITARDPRHKSVRRLDWGELLPLSLFE